MKRRIFASPGYRAGALLGRHVDATLRQLVTPEGVALPVHVASAGARLGALFLDLLVIGVITAIVAIALFAGLLSLVGETGGANDPNTGALAELIAVLFIIFTFLLRHAYFIGQEMSQRGGTWGKRIMKVRVADRSGGRLTPSAIVARNLIRDIELFLPLTFIGVSLSEGANLLAFAGTIWTLIFALFLFTNRDRLRCGDLIAGTWVIDSPRAKLETSLADQPPVQGHREDGAVSHVFGEEELSFYGEYELKTLEDVLRRGNPDEMAPVAQAICTKIGWTCGQDDQQAFLQAYYSQLRARLESRMRFGKRRLSKYEDERG